MIFCCGACRAAAFRAGRAGDILPLVPSKRVFLDEPENSVADAAIEALVAPFGYGISAETAMARVEAAERALQAARREASKAFEAAGKSTSSMFAESAFVSRRTAEKWIAEAKAEASKPPESAWLREKAARAQRAEFPALMHLALSGKREQPAPETPEVSEAHRRENAVIAKFENAGPTERAAMISAAANRKGIVRPPRSNK